MHVAVVAFVPDAGDADLGLAEILLREAGGEELRLRGGLRKALGNAPAVSVESVGHGVFLEARSRARLADRSLRVKDVY